MALALDAVDALAKFDELNPNLSVIDLLLSGGGGLELCRKLKQHSDVPVLAISTLETSDDALEAGADAFLQKPLDPLAFVSTVKDLLGASAFCVPALAAADGGRARRRRPAAELWQPAPGRGAGWRVSRERDQPGGRAAGERQDPCNVRLRHGRRHDQPTMPAGVKSQAK